MSASFGSENIVFVPRGERLRLIDLASWSAVEIDVQHAAVRIAPEASAQLAQQLRKAGKMLASSKREKRPLREIEERVDSIVAATAAVQRSTTAGPTHDSDGLKGRTGLSASWWIRLTGAPGESFSPEDYDEHEGLPPGPCETHKLYGAVLIQDLDEFELAFPGRGSEAAFSLDLPLESAIRVRPLPPEEPLPILAEYCGARGASSKGNSVNLDPRGGIAGEHLACTPLCRMGEGMFATLYMHVTAPEIPRTVAAIRPRDMPRAAEVLGQSGFALGARNEQWICFTRQGDTVHLYHHLPGKETEGALVLPPILMVPKAANSTEPEARAELLAGILAGMERKG